MPLTIGYQLPSKTSSLPTNKGVETGGILYFYSFTIQQVRIPRNSTQQYTVAHSNQLAGNKKMIFPALPRTEAISFRDAKTKIFPGNKCLNFMRHEAVFTRMVLYLNYHCYCFKKGQFCQESQSCFPAYKNRMEQSGILL